MMLRGCAIHPFPPLSFSLACFGQLYFSILFAVQSMATDSYIHFSLTNLITCDSILANHAGQSDAIPDQTDLRSSIHSLNSHHTRFPYMAG